MATLPDINTASVSYIGYYNATNHGAAVINPEDALTNGQIHNYTVYDNGWEGLYRSNNYGDITVRIKTDGWVIAYLDQTKELATDVAYSDYSNPTTDNSAHLSGPWDIVDDWTGGRTYAPSLLAGTFRDAIQGLLSELSNWGDITFNDTDVGYYNYEYETATNVTVLGAVNTSYSSTKNYGMQYTSGTTLHQWFAAGGSHWPSYSGASSYVKFDGTTVANTDGSARDDTHGVIDILADNTLGELPDTEYTTALSQSKDSDGRPTLAHIILWS